MIESGTFISAKDTDILRGLAGRIAEISLDPVNQERLARWVAITREETEQ